MATRDDIYTAIRNADAAGDTASVQKLAAYLKTLPTDSAPTRVNTPEMTAKIENDQISQDAKAGPSILGELGQQFANLGAGAVRGAGSIGATILSPIDAAARAMNGGKPVSIGGYDIAGQDRREGMDAGLTEAGADPSSLAFKTGKVGTEIAGTAGAGGAAANLIGRAAPSVAAVVPGVIDAIRTGGMAGGNLIARTAGGAINGGLSAGLVDPSQAGAGALVGGIVPGAVKLAGTTGSAIGNAIRGGGVTPDVAALADRAKQLGIDIPADRIVNSKPLNAVAATLNYVPFSGRAATEEKMASQLNRALSRTFGQDSPNVTQALRKAGGDLGAKFDSVLQANNVKMTPQFQQALADAADRATQELGPEQAAIINRQVAGIQAKAASGQIDGQTAYNIKKTLDRIGERNSPEAFYARDLKRTLMDALNDSMTPKAAADFATLRKQYGNMLDLQNLAQNGAEGGVSIGRLANLKNIGNPDVQELADIAAQFGKTRESPHGALQRLVIGGGAAGAAGGLGALPLLPVAAMAGRGANAALNSNAARNFLLSPPSQNLVGGRVAQFGYRAAPVLAADQ